MIKIENNIIRNTSKVDYPKGDIFTYLETKLQPNSREKIAFVDVEKGTSLTYAELYDVINTVAHNLQRKGFQQGDILALYCHNSWEYVAMILAAWKLRGCVAPISKLLVKGEVARCLDQLRPQFIFVGAAGARMLQKLRAEADLSIKEVVCLQSHPGCITWSSLATAPPGGATVNLQLRPLNPATETALILQSSGTTGFPKAVEITHGSLVFAMCIRMMPMFAISAPKGIVYQPLSHVYGVILTLRYLAANATIFMMPSFDLDTYLRLLSQHKIPTMGLVPPVAVMMVNSGLGQKYDLSHIDTCMCGAAPLSPLVEQKLMNLLPKVKFIGQGYGLTESSGAMAATSSEDRGPHGSVGSLFPGLELKVIDASTKAALPANQIGEICVRGPCVMKGYRNNPSATKEAIDEGGWLHSGDLGYYTKEGYLFVVDRLKELIKYSAYQVAPAELEDLLLHHPAVADAGVIGVPDEERGELPMAWVVRRDGFKTTEKEIMDFVAERVAPFKKLRGGVRFVDMIPKSPSGKILRRVMREARLEPKIKSQL